MENDNSSTEYETLGDLFRRLRLERSLDVNDVSDETRIPAKTIRAMETDEYDMLPAPAFARGFYSLYAKMLDLDQDEIVRRYYDERSGNNTTKQAGNVPSPSWKHKNIGTMAERPSLTPGSIIGAALLVLILLVASIFWYVGYNPATHVSKWIRTFQDKPAVQQQQTETEIEDEQPTQQETIINEVQPAQEDAIAQSGVTLLENSKYQLAAEFPYDTQVSIVIDGGEPRDVLISADTIETWQAENTIILELPPQAKAELYLNGEPLALPAVVDDKITISIPE